MNESHAPQSPSSTIAADDAADARASGQGSARTHRGPRQPRRAPARGPRIRREQRTLEVMTRLYCQHHHAGPRQAKNAGPGAGADALCDQCRELLRYANRRLEHCPFGESKYACVDCQIHCYTEDMAAVTRRVMRYAGPRIWWRHPILALFHFLDGHWLHRPPGGRARERIRVSRGERQNGG